MEWHFLIGILRFYYALTQIKKRLGGLIITTLPYQLQWLLIFIIIKPVKKYYPRKKFSKDDIYGSKFSNTTWIHRNRAWESLRKANKLSLTKRKIVSSRNGIQHWEKIKCKNYLYINLRLISGPNIKFVRDWERWSAYFLAWHLLMVFPVLRTKT